MGGGSDDIGDVPPGLCPPFTLRLPVETFPAAPGHNWGQRHFDGDPPSRTKGVIAGAKVQAMTMIDILNPSGNRKASLGLFQQCPNQRRKIQKPSSARRQAPRPWLNERTMAQYSRTVMKQFYYNPAKYDTYLDQLGIKYPTVRTTPARDARKNN